MAEHVILHTWRAGGLPHRRRMQGDNRVLSQLLWHPQQAAACSPRTARPLPSHPAQTAAQHHCYGCARSCSALPGPELHPLADDMVVLPSHSRAGRCVVSPPLGSPTTPGRLYMHHSCSFPLGCLPSCHRGMMLVVCTHATVTTFSLIFNSHTCTRFHLGSLHSVKNPAAVVVSEPLPLLQQRPSANGQAEHNIWCS